jgi:AraC-like DNA-binding protein
MILYQHVPVFPLSQWIESFIYYRDFHPAHDLDRLLPDGNVTLIFDLTDEPKYIYDNESLKEIQSCRHVWLSGIRNTYITIPSGKDSEMLVVNFHKGKAYPFVDDPLCAFTDHVVDGDIAFGRQIHELRERLLAQPSPQQMFQCAEMHFLSIIQRFSKANPYVDFAVSQILRAPGQQVIARISDRAGYSQKHMIHMFKTHVGVPPKTFMRIMRFQKAVCDIEAQVHVDWSQVAFESGYYDHPHFIHDFKSFSGMTPLQYLAAKNDQLNYVPVA